MREIRIYQPGNYTVGESVQLSSEASHHVALVLRMQPGERLTLFCGDNREFNALVQEVQKKKVRVEILSEQIVDRESPRIIHLAQSLAKGERMELVIQKAVELGVTSISPLTTARSVVKLDAQRMEKKVVQWQAIAVSACEQSGRNTIPRINPILTLTQYLQTQSASLKLVLHPEGTRSWRDYSLEVPSIALLIGPEGGFSQEEIQTIYAAQFQPLCLGKRILRTETAALVALSVLQAVCGDL